MCKKFKLIRIQVLEVLFISLILLYQGQIVHSVKCSTCEDPTSCQNPKTVECTKQAVEKTQDFLSRHKDVKFTTTNAYKCFTFSVQFMDGRTYILKGCMDKGSDGCEGPFKGGRKEASFVCGDAPDQSDEERKGGGGGRSSTAKITVHFLTYFIAVLLIFSFQIYST